MPVSGRDRDRLADQVSAPLPLKHYSLTGARYRVGLNLSEDTASKARRPEPLLLYHHLKLADPLSADVRQIQRSNLGFGYDRAFNVLSEAPG